MNADDAEFGIGVINDFLADPGRVQCGANSQSEADDKPGGGARERSHCMW
jgi:hypothetical protein